MKPGEWWQSLDHEEPCRILETESLWGRVTCMVWLPRRSTSVRVRADRLVPLAFEGDGFLDRLSYTGAAARIADVLETDALIAPLEGKITPLPHQIRALQRAMSGDRIRYLLADEVGLGKTIEAGLIIRELKIRGLVRRVLVVAPAGLVLQWVSEMRTHFDEDFRLLLPGSFAAMRQVTGAADGDNLWRVHDQVICPLDSVKPVESRRGWSQEQIARYNSERFEDLIAAGWDLVVIDEAHRLGGSTDQVARFKLGETLAQTAPYLLLLSATPHQGKTDAFRRLIGFLDKDAVANDEPITREVVAPYVIRTEKRHAIDVKGEPLFKPRYTQLVPIAWDETRKEHRALYEAVTGYVRDGYNRAMKERQSAVGFLMILMQRMVTSSTAAIRAALERRLEVLDLPEGQLSLFPEDISEDWSNLEEQAQFDAVIKTRLKGLRNERKEVELLLSAARRCEAQGPDVKAEALLEKIDELKRESGDPDVKVLIFTEFVPTQAMLAEFLGNRGYDVVVLNGSMGLEERRHVQKRFATDAQVLISTDAGGEGLNLQFCHVIVNYDLPWNPMKLEQRIGRVDRIGQANIVRALNFALQDSVELRIREVLTEKLQTILDEFGVDKLADVLDSEEGGTSFEALFAQAIANPDDAERRAEELVEEIREKASSSREMLGMLAEDQAPDEAEARRLLEHQMPFWTERMTVAYLSSRSRDGTEAVPRGASYRLRWEDGSLTEKAVFRRDDVRDEDTTLLSLSDARLRQLVGRLPVHAPGQPVPSVVIPEISERTSGTWSLWRVALSTPSRREQRFLPVFMSDEGRSFSATARLVWDHVIALQAPSRPGPVLSGSDAIRLYEASREVAQQAGAAIFETMSAAHGDFLYRERAKGSKAFAARQRTIDRIGLPAVRAHRIKLLEEEQRLWEQDLALQELATPELSAVFMIRVAEAGAVS